MTPTLIYPYTQSACHVREIVSPRNSPLRLLTASLIRLTSAEPEARLDLGASEAVLDILGGQCSVNLRSPAGISIFPEIGARANVFAGRPTMLYLPRGSTVNLFCESLAFEAALFTAPARQDFEPSLILADEAQVRNVGSDNWQRTVITSVGENVQADRLIVGETINPPGNWSSSPPHKHDVDSETERAMEEIYLFKLNPAQGFGIQRVYTAPGAFDPFDVAYTVRDGDAVVIPRGYHPVVAAPGYQLCYLWALAGEERAYGAWTEDPDHAWIKGSKPYHDCDSMLSTGSQVHETRRP